jgi:hypothetical protein
VCRRVAHGKSRRDLLFAVPFEQAGEGLPFASREVKRVRVEDAQEGWADQPPELTVKEAKEAPLALREVTLAGTTVPRTPRATDGPRRRARDSR